MKITVGNATAISLGVIALLPQAAVLWEQGFAAFQGCKTLLFPVFTGAGLLGSAVVALFSERIQK